MAGDIMKHVPRFIIAKYTPDLIRYEPRNIGLLLWAHGQIYSRFLTAPEFVNDLKAYDKWIDFWNAEINDEEIAPLRGPAIPKSDPKCMDALLTTQEGNYELVDAGEMLSHVRVRDIDQAFNSLYEELIVPIPKRIRDEGTHLAVRLNTARALRLECDKIFYKTGIISRPDFRPKFDVTCKVRKIRKHLRFSYGIGKDRPESLFQAVDIDKDSSVHDAAFKMEAAIKSHLVPRSHAIAFYQQSVIENSKNGAADNKLLLDDICTTLNVENVHDTQQYLDAVLLSNISHIIVSNPPYLKIDELNIQSDQDLLNRLADNLGMTTKDVKLAIEHKEIPNEAIEMQLEQLRKEREKNIIYENEELN